MRAATATTRSLNEWVGFAVSSFSHSSAMPSSSASRGAGTSGVKPGSEAGVIGRRHREQVGVAPERRRAGRDPLARDGRTQRVPVVDRVERAEAARARAGRLERVLGRADATAKEKRRALSRTSSSRSTSVRVWHRAPPVEPVAEASQGRSLSLSRCGAGRCPLPIYADRSRPRCQSGARHGALGGRGDHRGVLREHAASCSAAAGDTCRRAAPRSRRRRARRAAPCASTSITTMSPSRSAASGPPFDASGRDMADHEPVRGAREAAVGDERDLVAQTLADDAPP